MTFRSAIPDFQLANPLYVGAVVSFWTVDVNGDKTGTLANLYSGAVGATQVSNPQILDAEGKFVSAVYHSVPVIAEVVSSSAGTVETGIILPYAVWGGDWTSGTLINGNTLLRDPVNLSIYIATNTYVTAGSINTDVTAGNLVLVFQGESAAIASAAAATAVQAALDADASETAVAAMLSTTARTQAAGTTNGIIQQSGTTAQRVTPGAGVIVVRYNTSTARLEMYAGSWGALILSIGHLGDVDLSTPPSTGDSLVWNNVSGTWKPGGLNISSVAGDIIPDADSTRDLGSSAKAWAEAHVDEVRTASVSNQAGSSRVTVDTILQGAAKAWFNLNGTGTIAARDSFNVSSFVDNGSGDYSANLTVAFPNSSYSIAGSSAGTSGVVAFLPLDVTALRSASAYRVGSLNASFSVADSLIVESKAHGDPA